MSVHGVVVDAQLCEVGQDGESAIVRVAPEFDRFQSIGRYPGHPLSLGDAEFSIKSDGLVAVVMTSAGNLEISLLSTFQDLTLSSEDECCDT